MRALKLLTLMLAIMLVNRRVTVAQSVSELPRAEYYAARELFRSGRAFEAVEGFKAALTKARMLGEQRWVDSIPPIVMLGEYYYLQGNLPVAIEHYDAALTLALAYPTWIDQIEVQPEMATSLEDANNGINWFPKSRPTKPVAVPEGIQITLDPSQAQVGPQGSVVVPVGLITRLDATEVLRCMGIALMRRAHILGPLSPYSPLAPHLDALLARTPASRVPWLMSSWAALRGIHAMALPNGRDPRGLLRTAARIQDQYDYFLTPLSLIVLAQAEAHEGSYQAAIVLLQDAALLAAQFQQYEMLAEALQLLAGCATASQRMDLLEPLQRASTWSGNKSGLAHLAGMVGTAELSLAGGNFAQADKLLKQAATIFKGRESGFARYQAQLSFVTAQLAYGQDRAPVGISNLDNALKLLRGNAQAGIMVEPVFQTQMALDLLAGGQLTAQDTEHILQQTLAEPGTAEWEVSPLETLAAITTPRLPAYERLLELAVDRGADDDIVLERMDLVQRQRFYEALPLGGRLFSWRIALGIDPQKLAPEDRRVVEWSLQRFTGAKASAQRIQQLIEQLRQLPPPMDDRGLAPDAKRNFDELDTLASRFENQLAFLSLQRKNLTRFAPSAASPARIQQTLGDSDLAVGFLVTPQRLLGVASTKQEMYFWKQNLSGEISEPLGKLFKGIGLVRPVGGIPPSTVTDPGAAWHGAAQELATLLIPPEVDAMIGRARRLIIVPNGQLWYVPFELLPNAGTATGTPWIAEHEIVYVPTLGSLALAFGPRPVVQHTVGVVGGMFSLDRSANEAQATKLLQAVPASQALFTSQKISTPSMDWLRIATDQLWVANEIDGSGTGWDAVVAPIGASRHLQIGSWLETPRASPDRVLLPGWNAGLSGGSLDSGNEIFLPACALTFSGTRSALLSRWPAKGVSASTFLLRYLEELQQESPAHAMRRAVLSQWSEQFLIADEPNLLPAGKETEALSSGSHPLLWSGYMSIGDYQVPR